jgi:DNA-binding phage protein
MSGKFDAFMKELEVEARRGGPKALAELAVFGAKAGIPLAEISRIEAGSSNPMLSTLATLAQALGAKLSLSPARP